MNILKELDKRSNSQCELCAEKENLAAYPVQPTNGDNLDETILICATCSSQIEDPALINPNHWRCLNDSMWSEVPAVQVMAWRMLTLLRAEGWPQDLLDMLYLDEETLTWAKATGIGNDDDNSLVHLDANGAVLTAGDTVVLIKDLNVKGANFTAKRGTAVRNISLVHDNAEQIEGRVSGQHIVILTKFVKKNN
ncbi:PhnA domain-containing protein [Aquimarina intermedia]|uniref:Phosphonoacetate hydrolase n=1 Tax=Aquimarina intermedia TaxID=350814 RepID=A0A5S5C9F6_9FLAO|nr:alkylphosphonate utilization protein [Aquimarina intermedia]TYP75006.1 phosphonoacetate hydrolase [Aquimarina intermedia]